MEDPAPRENEEQHRVQRPAPLPAVASPQRDAGPEGAAERLASSIGNHNMNQVVARMTDGSGLDADGTVHADVVAAIDAMSGGGHRVDRQLLDQLRPTHGDLSDARIHTGAAAEQLARAVSAKAFTVGTDIFMGRGADHETLVHELSHVPDQRNAPKGGPLKATFPGDAYERSAEERASAALG